MPATKKKAAKKRTKKVVAKRRVRAIKVIEDAPAAAAPPVAQAAPEPIVTKMVEPHEWTDGGDRVLILRRINKDGTSYGGFNKWGKPDELNITVQPEKFVNQPTCGNGLHGWPWGMGLGDGSDYSVVDDRWLVIAAKPEDVVGNVGGSTALKCKCREAVKIFDGTFAGAWALINNGRHRLIQAMTRCVSSDGSQLAASGYGSHLAASGKSSIAAAIGIGSIVAAGELGCIVAAYWSAAEDRYRVVVGYVGENGIEPNTNYRLNAQHQFEAVK